MPVLAPKQVTITRPKDEEQGPWTRTFMLHSLPVWTSNALNKNMLAIFGPSLSGIEGGLALKSGFNVGKAAEAVSKVLGDMPDEKFQDLFVKLFSTTYWLPDGQDAAALGTGAAPLPLKDPDNLNAAFERDLEGMYKLAVAVMEYNKFPFFARILRAGRGMLATLTSSDMTKSSLNLSEPSGTSETSPQS